MKSTTKNKLKKITFIDLFSGIGGFRIALEKHRAKCVFSSDWDKDSQRVYEENFNEKPYGDITKVREKDIPNHNILCAGFPCQAFSVSGKQKGFRDTRGTLFFEIVRILKYHKPEVVFLENVKHFAKHDSGKTLEVILSTLEELGYKCSYTILNSSFYGVPQSRERFYLVGFRNDLGVKNFQFPKPCNKRVQLLDILEKNGHTANYAIDRKDIKFFDYVPRLQKDIFGNYPMKPIQIGIINKGGQGERIYSIEGHAITLSSQGGGAASKTGA
ncbi:MAG: DNA (cytosine-5-)-methyltransferase, partial [Candidatus Melainabacteria bacterium]|nr:DNA (cytosine-5-)-methyltransferase [Candidatus Melainabacteria bacterium]